MEYNPGKFSKLANEQIGIELWNYLTQKDNVLRMETATDLGRPAVEAVAGRLVKQFGERVINEDRVKQMIGHMARQIMENSGYEMDAKNVKIIHDKRLFKKASRYKDGTAKTTTIGYINRNNQLNKGHRGEKGTDHNSTAYKLECLECHHSYWANGTDIFQRKCSKCQNGAVGLDL